MVARNQLRKQPEWRGCSLMVKNILVCDKCYDKPNEQLRTIFIPADPVPIRDPRPLPPYNNQEDD